MGIIEQQIVKAEQRASTFDLLALVKNARDKVPRDLATEEQMRDRLSFLEQSLENTEVARGIFERIIYGNELQDVNYLPRGEYAARSIARIAINDLSGKQRGWATGFMIAPRVLLTNHHVFPSLMSAKNSVAQFEAERDINGTPKEISAFRLVPDELFYAFEALDFSVVAIESVSYNTRKPLANYGTLPLVGRTGKVADGEWLTIVQHPNGELKQLCARENKLIKRTEDSLWYSTDTLGGSSGSPVFNNDWYVVALHHSGIPEKRNGIIQTLDGKDYDPMVDPGGASIKWIANEGIRVSRIVSQLRSALPNHALIEPLLESTPVQTTVTPYTASLDSSTLNITSGGNTALNTPPSSPERAMSSSNSKVIQLSIHIGSDGEVRIGDSASAPTQRVGAESFEATKKSGGSSPKKANFDIKFDTDYSTRKGFDEAFLGSKVIIHLPELSPALKKIAAPLLESTASNKFVLHYHNYSVVMNAERRFAMYSAANVRADQRFDMSRPADVWRTDPRIEIEHQITDFYYRNNQFDRGHLTRREDLEFGKSAAIALASAADTCHWTNSTPQHAKFNQNKELWQGIERHLLEGAIETGNYNTQVFTGPLLAEDDPVYGLFPDIQYPTRFWKVVSTLKADGNVFATAYLLDQSDVIAQFGIESTEEIPFGAYKTFQVKIEEIERLTGLKFTATIKNAKHSLSDFDPLAVGAPRARRGTRRFNESTMNDSPAGYVPLADFSDIIL